MQRRWGRRRGRAASAEREDGRAYLEVQELAIAEEHQLLVTAVCDAASIRLVAVGERCSRHGCGCCE